MKIQKIIRGVEVGIYLGLGMYSVKTISTLLVGYIAMKPNMGGLPLYYWRKEYSNPNAAKNAYGFIDPNTETDTALFRAFSATVQPMYNEKKLSSEKESQSEIVEKNKDSWFFKYKAEKATNKIEEIDEKLKKAKTTVNDLTPLYSVGGSDSFVLGPKKTFKIFRTKGDAYNEKALESEMQFLAFKNVFFKYLKMNTKEEDYDKKSKSMSKQEPKNWVPLKEELVGKFFSSKGASPLKFGSPKDITLADGQAARSVKIEITAEDNKTESVVFLESHADAVKKYISAYGDFEQLFDMLEDNEGLIQFSNDGKVTADSKLTDLLWTISNKIGFSENFNNDRSVFDKQFTEFITRSVLIKPNAFDVHIMNRLHYIYLMMNSDLNPEGLDNKYDELKKKGEEFHNLLAGLDFKTASKSQVKELVAKKTLNVEKMRKRRIGLIFDDLSSKIAKNLGNKGYYLKSAEEDERLPFFKYFAYPGIYGTKDEKKVEPVFDKVVPAPAS